MEHTLDLVKEILRDDLGMRRVKFTPMAGGHTGAYTAVMTSPDGRSAFMKWATGGAIFGRQSLTREVSAHVWLPESVVGSAKLLASRRNDEGIAASFGVSRAHPIQHWNTKNINAAVKAVRAAHATLKIAEAPIGLADVDSRLSRALDDKTNPWKKDVHKFAEMAFTSQYRDEVSHGDLHRGNILVPEVMAAATIVDWASVSRVPSVFDIAMLSVDIGLDQYDPWDIAGMAGCDLYEFRLALGAYAAALWVMEHTDHKHARTRRRRREVVEYALS